MSTIIITIILNYSLYRLIEAAKENTFDEKKLDNFSGDFLTALMVIYLFGTLYSTKTTIIGIMLNMLGIKIISIEFPQYFKNDKIRYILITLLFIVEGIKSLI